MQARISNPVRIVPDALQALLALGALAKKGGVPPPTHLPAGEPESWLWCMR
jgi:hypothetical protein